MFKNRTFTSAHAPRSSIVLYLLTAFFREALFQYIVSYTILYAQLLSPIIHEDTKVYSLLFLILNIFIIVTKLFASIFWAISGHMFESVRCKSGRYRTFIFVGMMIYITFFILLCFVAPLFNAIVYVVLFGIFQIMIQVGFSINDVAYWGYLSTVSKDEEFRGRVSSGVIMLAYGGSYLLSSLVPVFMAGDNSKTSINILCIVLIFMTVLPQLLLSIFMREKDEVFVPSEKKNIFNSFKIVFSNKQVFFCSLVSGLMYLIQGCFIGNSVNYFYYEYGYGSFGDKALNGSGLNGGVVSFIFTLIYGVAVIVANFIYPYIAKKLKKKKLLIISIIALSISYLVLFFFGFSAGNEILLFIFSFIIGFFQGVCTNIGLLNSTDNIEYYEYVTGQRKVGEVLSSKESFVLISSALTSGLFYLSLFSSGLLSVNSKVAALEAKDATGNYTGANLIVDINNAIHETDIHSSLVIMRIFITIVPMIFTLIALFISLFGIYVNDEKKYEYYISELEKRKAKENNNSTTDNE